MKLVHISDTHGPSFHAKMTIPDCDVLIHSGDFSEWRGNLMNLTEFLIWFEKQPAKVKIFTAGNHDLVMDKQWANKREDKIAQMIAMQQHKDALELIKNYNVVYLNDTGYTYEGIKFWGSPYSPSFGYDWAFNADKGTPIMKHWAKIPSDVDILITHTPVYGFLDRVSDKYLKEGETDNHKGCKDLLSVIQKRLLKLKLHCCGHIHDDIGLILRHVSNNRRVWFSNASTITNDAIQLIFEPIIIQI